MNQIIKVSLILSAIFLLITLLPACDSKRDVNNSEKKAMINDVSYTSLTEAVNNAQNGDTIKIRNDIKENKNIIITKPLTIIGVASTGQTKPKFYGSITINLPGAEDCTTIENIELIHEGIASESVNNDTSIGINLIDGGLNLTSSIIELSSDCQQNNPTIGLMVSRKADSISTMPITITGNGFGSYYSNDSNSSAAIIINRNKEGVFQNIFLDEAKLFDENSFFTHKISNQLISINHSTTPATYSYFSTSSIDMFINAIDKMQNPEGCTLKLFAKQGQSLKEVPQNALVTLEKTNLSILGDSPLDFSDTTLNIKGYIYIEPPTLNLSLNKASSTACIIKNKS